MKKNMIFLKKLSIRSVKTLCSRFSMSSNRLTKTNGWYFLTTLHVLGSLILLQSEKKFTKQQELSCYTSMSKNLKDFSDVLGIDKSCYMKRQSKKSKKVRRRRRFYLIIFSLTHRGWIRLKMKCKIQRIFSLLSSFLITRSLPWLSVISFIIRLQWKIYLQYQMI